MRLFSNFYIPAETIVKAASVRMLPAFFTGILRPGRMGQVTVAKRFDTKLRYDDFPGSRLSTVNNGRKT